MLTLKNCSVPDFKKEVGNRRVIPFGVGSWFKTLEVEDLSFLTVQCPYAIDNDSCKYSTFLHGKKIPVYTPEMLKLETDCVILLVSPVYMYDMYKQLDEMELDGNITCYGFPFMTITESGNMSENQLDIVLQNNKGNSETKIPRIIHGFWFSGEKKTNEYQNCFDSWRKKCPDFDIREWTKENYDTETHPFMKKAIDYGAWAFASDYARLEVLYKYGGFYLDMDVELLKPLDDLLNNSAILNFSKSTTVDLAVVGAKPKHPLIKKLLDLYDKIQVPETRTQFNDYFQPSLIHDVIKSTGVKFDGKLQILEDGTVFLPRTFFFPMDSVIFEKSAMSKYSYAIHYDNFGWSIGDKDIRSKKLKENRLLYSMIQK